MIPSPYFLFIFAALIAFPSLASADQSQNSPFVVVELFSSEGCSSCPAADLLVSKVTAWARQNNQPVYPLIFHVDYWNSYGWRDVFSSAEFTRRQNEYARVFKDQGVYTPEIVVNGSDAFVGSDQGQLQQDLNRELSQTSNIILHASFKKKDGQVVVKYSAEGFTKGDVVNIALVERGLSTDVTAGENAGRTLHHDNVVREFETRPLTKAGNKVIISLNKILDISQASLIVYVQDPQTMLIEAAKQLDLEND
jgi:hypothetical protein